MIGIIGGSGIYDIENIEKIKEINIKTPFGKTSAPITIAKIEGKEVAFLPRHGKGHIYSPTELPVKAAAWAFKKLGISKVIAISAVGSLKEEIKPRDFVIPFQIIDRTKLRNQTLFEHPIVGHVSMADPFCIDTSNKIYEIIISKIPNVHKGKTYLCIEGPQFSTRAESNLYRSWGADIIGMTAIPEAKIFRESEICYSMIALSTDYDCWHEEDVTVEMVISNMKYNIETLKKLIPDIVKGIEEKECVCHSAAKNAIVTNLKEVKLPRKIRKKLEIFYGKYWV
ncbi:MAG TPA: S-methyl-5'-thioadenosine phosphorylase [Spirochaetota bacterium]|nr:S-methyl-5'-thioadenosine phosphorylase [Spirochaetota bacterium]HOM38109.1 S-methyl-5'-thioadenosine phosphorylase [Spirochaetota bacterium]HPQ48911.1 S-methyl-5'-thioadenosine phosphorylase [Spirochaetota bacterium]